MVTKPSGKPTLHCPSSLDVDQNPPSVYFLTVRVLIRRCKRWVKSLVLFILTPRVCCLYLHQTEGVEMLTPSPTDHTYTKLTHLILSSPVLTFAFNFLTFRSASSHFEMDLPAIQVFWSINSHQGNVACDKIPRKPPSSLASFFWVLTDIFSPRHTFALG